MLQTRVNIQNSPEMNHARSRFYLMSNKPRANTPEEKRKEAEKLAILFLGDPDNGRIKTLRFCSDRTVLQ